MIKTKENRDSFVEENIGLVHSICKRFAGRGIEYDDLFGAGCMGLVKAVNAFDDSRGIMFSTYAVPVIMGEVRRLFRDGGAVKISRSVKELFIKISRERSVLEQKLGREPTISEIAEKIKVPKEDIAEAISACRPTVSLTYEDENGVSEMDLPSVNDEENIENRIIVSEALKNLPETEREIIRLRYFCGMTQNEISEKFSMSQVQISRLEKRILQKLRQIML